MEFKIAKVNKYWCLYLQLTNNLQYIWPVPNTQHYNSHQNVGCYNDSFARLVSYLIKDCFLT